jgi:hypothetical protein
VPALATRRACALCDYWLASLRWAAALMPPLRTAVLHAIQSTPADKPQHPLPTIHNTTAPLHCTCRYGLQGQTRRPSGLPRGDRGPPQRVPPPPLSVHRPHRVEHVIRGGWLCRPVSCILCISSCLFSRKCGRLRVLAAGASWVSAGSSAGQAGRPCDGTGGILCSSGWVTVKRQTCPLTRHLYVRYANQ